jgi:hypothetical protein
LCIRLACRLFHGPLPQQQPYKVLQRPSDLTARVGRHVVTGRACDRGALGNLPLAMKRHTD